MTSCVNIVRMPKLCGVISSIDVGAAAAYSIGYWSPARYRSNPIMRITVMIWHQRICGLALGYDV